MILRDFYNKNFGYNFYLFSEFIKAFGDIDSFNSLFSLKKEDFILSFDDINEPLYDYLYGAIEDIVLRENKESYNYSFLYEFFDKDFLDLFLSEEGEKLILSKNIYNTQNIPISIETDANLSKDNFLDISYIPNITKDENFLYLDRYKGLSGFKYIKDIVILNKIRDFFNFEGASSFFYNLQEESNVFKMFNVIEKGLFREEDLSLFYSNQTIYENVYNYING